MRRAGMKARKAFTLVELLVVIAIISILAAMLLPALEEARHAALLASCVNGYRQVGQGLLMYAGDTRGRYPRRQVNAEAGGHDEAYNLKNTFADDRPMLRPYVDIVLLNCAFRPEQNGPDIDGSSAKYVYCSSGLWFGSEIVEGQRETGMLRIGDRPQYNGSTFDILACDVEREATYLGNMISAAHPDADGVLSPSIPDGAELCANHWSWKSGTPWRGELDRSFLHDDGSVRVLARLEFRDTSRVTKVRGQPSASESTAWAWLPPCE